MSGVGRGPRGRLVLVAAGLLAAVASPGGEAGAPSVSPSPPGQLIHVVAPGESLTRIARRYGVTIGALVSANPSLTPTSRLRVNQPLAIPAPSPVRSPGPAAPGLPFDLVLAIPDFDGQAPRFEWPLNGTVISPFGRRRGGWHRGIDIRADLGTPVFAAAAGIVAASDVEPSYGNVVKIEHSHDFMTIYAHHLQNLVHVGDVVETGQVIGQVGRTGRATAYHLHFEIRYKGAVYDPLYLLPSPPRPTQVAETEDEPADDE
ncbi:MAG: hypothetical protein DME06_01640 [Candidatus Rokuibacteriota bacterium]|nr:MAG: hypothetical protein DME06_01640 [Candidatus Rokubacteria bacterium]